MKYVDGCLACSKEEPGSLSPNGIRSRQGLAETWRARVSRMRRRRFKNDQSEIVPGRGETKTCETVVFSWIVYKSRAHRDKVNDKAMKDPRLAGTMKTKKMPFDSKRMAYGGCKVMVDA